MNASGESLTSDDASVFLTGELFETCKNISCMAGIIAHEATHSWIEARIEAKGQDRSATDMDAAAAEEGLADIVAMAMGDPQGLLTDHKQAMLANYDDPRTFKKYLEDFYAIDLSDLNSDVYGK